MPSVSRSVQNAISWKFLEVRCGDCCLQLCFVWFTKLVSFRRDDFQLMVSSLCFFNKQRAFNTSPHILDRHFQETQQREENEAALAASRGL